MNNQYYCNNLNDIFVDLGKDLSQQKIQDSRNGNCRELEDVDIYLLDPRQRYLHLPGRTNNIFATMAETFWVFGGDNGKLFPIMTTFLPRSVNYSDDLGVTWRGNYTKRIFINNQISSVLEQFRNDGLNTRRAVMSIWRPDMDSQSVIGNCNKSKDIPCTNFINLWIRDNKLNMKVQFRSNDLVYGLSGINVFEWTFLQEIISDMISKEFETEVDLGYYHHSVISLHAYDFTFNQILKVLEGINSRKPDLSSHQTLKCFLNYENGYSKPEFFRKKMEEICNIISGYCLCRFTRKDKFPEFSEVLDISEKLFGNCFEDNAMYYYLVSVCAFLFAKNNINDFKSVEDVFVSINFIDVLKEKFPALYFAIKDNRFYSKELSFSDEEINKFNKIWR